ncbi:hypothetical protein M5G07_01155 [Serratia symbiotica]|nr:hypothetical protein [Serratia symbiotica]
MLASVRRDLHSPTTRISNSRLAISQLSREDLETLASQLYSIKIPYCWHQSMQVGREETELIPLISQNQVLPDIRAVFYPGMIVASTPRAEVALERFYGLVKENANDIGIDICPGAWFISIIALCCIRTINSYLLLMKKVRYYVGYNLS